MYYVGEMQDIQGSELRSACLKIIAFFTALFLASLFVALHFPVTQKSAPFAQSFKLAREEEEEGVPVFVGESMDSEKDYTAYMDENMDSALSWYRNPLTRSSVVLFYSGITGSRAISEAVLKEASRNEISPSLAFALAYAESRYKRSARNVNTDNSVDRGLFQLNSKTFPSLSDEDYFNVELNAKYALSHLAWCLDASKRNEKTALCIYNAGEYRVKKGSTPNMTLRYAERILSYKRALDARLEKDVRDEFFLNKSGELAFVKLP